MGAPEAAAARVCCRPAEPDCEPATTSTRGARGRACRRDVAAGLACCRGRCGRAFRPGGSSAAVVVDDAAPDGEATVQLWGAEDKAAGLSRIRATVMLEVPTALLGTSSRRPTRRRVCALVLDGAPGRLLLLADAVHSGMLRHRTEFGPRARFAAVAATSESRFCVPRHRAHGRGGDDKMSPWNSRMRLAPPEAFMQPAAPQWSWSPRSRVWRYLATAWASSGRRSRRGGAL